MTVIPGLLFADDLAFSSFTTNSLQKTLDQVLKYCREWKLKCNLNKTKILVCKKSGKLKKDERWFVNDYQIEVVNEVNYLGVLLESTGGWNRQRCSVIAKGTQTLVAIDKCLARTPDMRVATLENIYEMCESRMMYGVQMWGLEGGWKQIDKIHSRFCKVTLGMPRSAANNVAELELGRVSRRGKVLNRITKFWLRLLGMDSLELIKLCYEWQMKNLKVDSWAKKLKDELEKMGLAYISQNQTEINVNICNIIRESWNDIQKQNMFADLNVKVSLTFYRQVKCEWGKEWYIDKRTRKERIGVIWLKAGIWKLKGIRRGLGKGRCPLFGGEDDEKHILLK
jgi:hypothetical protein